MEERSLTIHGKLEFDPGAIVYCRKRQQLIVTNYSDDITVFIITKYQVIFKGEMEERCSRKVGV